MKTLNSAALALIVATLTAPALAVGGLGGSGNAQGGVNSDSIEGAKNQNGSDPIMEEQDELQKRKNNAERSIEDSDQAATDRERRMEGGGSFSADSNGFSGQGGADTEEAEE